MPPPERARRRRALLLEPYFGESHRRLVDGLTREIDLDWQVATMPPRKWKWRMRGAALHLAPLLHAGPRADLLVVAGHLSLPDVLALGPRWLHEIPRLLYLHENQLVYPERRAAEWDFHFGLTNIISALAADRVAFNSAYHRDSFLEAVPRFIKRFPDHRPKGVAEAIAAKSSVLPVPIDPGEFEGLAPALPQSGVARIVWNQRWEFDKNPEECFETLIELANAGVVFELIVLGESFREQPPIFARARLELADRIVQFGHVASRGEYLRWLAAGDIVVSTALHEFFGVAVLEAVRAGCRAVVPDRLAYPEIFPAAWRYPEGGLAGALTAALSSPPAMDRDAHRALAARYDWPHWRAAFQSWLVDR